MFALDFTDEAVKLVIITGRPVATMVRVFGRQEWKLGRQVKPLKTGRVSGNQTHWEIELEEPSPLPRDNGELKPVRAFQNTIELSLPRRHQ